MSGCSANCGAHMLLFSQLFHLLDKNKPNIDVTNKLQYTNNILSLPWYNKIYFDSTYSMIRFEYRVDISEFNFLTWI